MTSKLIILTLLLTSCASGPVFYPNEQYKSVGKEQAKAEAAQCKDEANEFLESSKGQQMASGAKSGGVRGAVYGVLGGLLSGKNIGEAALGGAAAGATIGTVEGGLSPDQIKQNYVTSCLNKRGYRIIGWR